jgi:hypothetical protein
MPFVFLKLRFATVDQSIIAVLDLTYKMIVKLKNLLYDWDKGRKRVMVVGLIVRLF